MFFSRFRGSTSRPAAPRVPDGLRVYAIGDVHGRMDLLRPLLDQMAEDSMDATRTQVIFLGDYIDRGGDSRAVLDTLIAGKQSQAWVCLKGNHEAMLLSAIDGAQEWEFWLANGGLETLFSYGVSARELVSSGRSNELHDAVLAAVPPDHIEFLRNLDITLTLGDYFFCHAGVRPGVALDRQVQGDLLWIREAFTHSNANHGKRIVHGHTPVMEAEILSNRINIDTGAYLTNRLSCVVLEGDEVRILHT